MGVLEIAGALSLLALIVWFFRESWTDDLPPNDPDVKFDDGTVPSSGRAFYAYRGYGRWLDLANVRDALSRRGRGAKNKGSQGRDSA